ncbi:MAG: NAD(P)-dependent oxidoreductase [Paludibacter sp.]|jgi:UDP-glucose 4-epimerase|nr:NAD(P)-dependent oxidoreductase [Paludibacter sp.]
MKKKILIIGANGYLGAQISIHLANQGYKVSGLCFPEIPNDTNWINLFENLFVSDIRDTKKLAEIAENQYDILIHLVSLDHHQSNASPDFVASVNITPTWNLLDIFTKKGLKKFIFFSTIHIYGKDIAGDIAENYPTNSQNPYALTHCISETICKYYAVNSETDCTIVRLSNSYGSPVFSENNCWWLVVNDLCRQAFSDKKIVLQSDGSPLRDFINGIDVCRAVENIIENGEKNETYHISSGKTYSILELAQIVQKIYKSVYNKQIDILTAKSTQNYPKKYIINNNKLTQIGFSTSVSLDEGVKKIFEYFEKKQL